jgi:hypothetical protein
VTSAEYWMYDGRLGRRWNLDPIPVPWESQYAVFRNNPILLNDPLGLSPGDPAPGELKGETSKIKANKNGMTLFIAPDGTKHPFKDAIGYTYSDGKEHDGQLKKAGVWSVTTKGGKNYMWDNINSKFVENTSDKGGGENEFPTKVGLITGATYRPGTTYAGGENNAMDKNNPENDNYSQPPQNIADAAGRKHDLTFKLAGLEGTDGSFSPASTPANTQLIIDSKKVIQMYKAKSIDPYTGMRVTKKTMEAAQNMVTAFEAIEKTKKVLEPSNKWPTSYTPSDSILKRNVHKIEDATQKLRKLNGYTYQWKDTLGMQNNLETIDYGVLAQEVEKLFPSFVLINKDGVKTVAYYKLIPVLVEAFKEQNRIIELYGNRLKILEDKLK